MLQLLSLIMLVYSYFVIATSIPNLPRFIPTHFNAAGVADGWGSPETLWILLGAQALVTAVFLLMPYFGQRFPGAVHFGSRRLSDYPVETRQKLIPVLNELAGWLSVVMSLFFVYMLRQVVHAATEADPHLDALRPLVLMVVATGAVMLVYFRKFRRVGEGRGNAD